MSQLNLLAVCRVTVATALISKTEVTTLTQKPQLYHLHLVDKLPNARKNLF